MQSMLNAASGEAMPPKETNYTVCPNPECSRVWNIDEIEYQACDECGYPLHQEQAEAAIPETGEKDLVFDFSKREYLH